MNKRVNLGPLVVACCWIGLGHPVLGNPTGGQVAAGSAAIGGQGTSAVTIKQAGNLAIINWQTFSIGSGESTTFVQPSASSAALNRVLGGQTSLINGTLTANGSIYLVNGNGIVVGPGGVITANAFTASTRDIADSDFLSGNLHFVGNSSAGVQNLGTISALGGDVVLIGKTVDNQGKINARKGTAGLIAGDDVLLGQKNGDGSTVTVSPDPLAASASTQVGVKNSGKISAAAAELKAANGNLYALAIQNEGTIRATTVKRQGGHIWLTSDSGSIVNTGTLNASSRARGGHGGTVTMKNMGGTTIDTGAILAKGGQGGVGGNAEVSGAVIQFEGGVDLTAINGFTGNLLLDPDTLEIVASGGTGAIGSLPATGDSTINASSLVSALNGANITLNANNSISVNAAVNASGNGSAGNLILDAPTLDFNAAVTLRLGSNLSGNASTVNVGASGFIQNGVDAAAAGAAVNLAGATYDLNGQVVINKNLTLQGATNGSTILDGQGVTREIEIDGTSSGDTVNLNYLTLTNGSANNGSSPGGDRSNDGGGVLVFTESSLHATVTLNDCTVSDNVANNQNGGGGIYIAAGGGGFATVAVNNSTVSGNSTNANPGGGGIYSDVYGGGSSTLTITDSAIVNNTATVYGGGIYNEGSGSSGTNLVINNSTISGNIAGSGGGGIYDDSAATQLTIGDTILAGNTVGSTESDLTNYGTVTDHGYNLFGQNGDAGGFTGNGTTDIELADGIGTAITALGNYGGPTETEALVAGSPAYLAGGARGSVTTDQRGDSRGSVISIGAWDYNPTQFTAANSTIVNTASDAVGDVIGGTTVSLRDALFYSNVGAVTNPTITFNTNPADGTDFSTSQTIDLVQGELVINKSVTVDGFTTGSVIVSGQGATRDMEIDGTSSGITVTLNNLTLTDGNASGSTGGVGAVRYDDGGGLLVYAQAGLHATVTINDCTVSNNTADGQNGGGGIYLGASNGGFTTATITNSTISGNSEEGTQGGGGIYNDGYDGTAVLTITNSTIANNTALAQGTGGYGGAIYNEGAGSSIEALVTVGNSTISGNSASTAGGGIYNDINPATLVISDTILAANTANGVESDVYNYNGGVVTDHGYNLYGQNGSAGGFTGNGTTDIELAGSVGTAITALGNYGGPTETMALVTGSPAYLAGGAQGSVMTDQRGDSRGNVISIGAWDYNPTQFTAANSTIVNTASDAAGDIIGGTTVSLRDALFYSNVGAVTNPTITFNTNPADGTDFSTSQTIDLVQGELVINKSVTVDGSSTGSVIVSGQGATRELEIDGTSSGDTVNLNYLTLTDGNASSNTTGLGAPKYDDGGGLLVYAQNGLHATVTINDCTISNNTAEGQNGGGGIYLGASGNGFTTVTITDSTISGNTGGGAQGGGGIYNDGFFGTAVLTITNSTIANNTAIAAGSGGYGGAIYNEGAGGPEAVITVSNNTISGNSASTAGGGIYNDGADGTLVFGDTILAGNTVGAAESDLVNNGGTLTDGGYNLYGQNGSAGGFIGNGTTDIELAGSISTVLDPLANNGGPTETMTLVAGSPALGNGSSSLSISGYTLPNTDQRGDPRSTGPAGEQVVDIGAYQDQGVSVSATVAASGTVTYGSGNSVTVTLTPTAGQNLGTVTLTDQTDNDTVTGTLSRQSNGTYTATIMVPAGFDAGNLSTTVSAYGHYEESTANTLTVDQAALTITADDKTKVYGAALPTLTASYTGFVNGDTASSLTTDPTLSTTATASSSVAGSPYVITASGAADNNYTISYVAGSLDVTPAPLTITADNQTKEYGAPLPPLTASYSGFVNGDTSASLTTGPTLFTTATASSSVAGSPYAITASGAVDSNYDISYVDGALVVTPAPLTITADSRSKVYGAALPTLTASYSGFVNGDTAASLTTGPTLTTTATTGSPVAGSPYTITVGGAADGNYSIGYVAGTLNVTPATLQYLANSVSIQIGQTIPPLTGTVIGFVNGDSLTNGATTGTLIFSTAATGSIPGTFAINGSGLSAANYVFVQAPGNATALTIGGFEFGQPGLSMAANRFMNFASQFNANANYETLFTQSWFPLFDSAWNDGLVPVYRPVNVPRAVYSEHPARYAGTVKAPSRIIAFGSSFQYMSPGGGH